MGKHMKKLRAEKAKVQLKKKKLPKGQNITDTSFKVKKIQIAEQLPQRADGEIVTLKNQTLKDLLNHLQHHNVNIQLDGLQGIKELFFTHPELANGLTLRQVVTRVLELVVEDREKKVRRAAIAVLSTILSPLSSEVRAPFIDLLNKQLQRGLSHIHAGIQRDSLRLMDVVASISGRTDVSSQKHLLGLLLRLLTLTGSGAPTRIAVVRRLLAISETVFGNSIADDAACKEVNWNEEIIEPLTAVYHRIPRLSFGSITTGRDASEGIQPLIERLTHALIGVWTECSPDSVVADSSVELLRLIVRHILVICQHLDAQMSDPETIPLKNWYAGKFRKSLGKTFLGNFPFRWLGEVSHGSRQIDFRDKADASPELVALNIDIARLYYWFKVCKPELDIKVERFIDECMNIRPVSLEMFYLLQLILNMKSKKEATVLKIIESYLKSEDPRLLSLLSDIVLDPSRDYQSHPLVWRWVVSLAHNFSSASNCRLKILATLAGRGGDKALEEAVRKEMPKILFKDQAFDETLKIKLHILYWCCAHEELKRLVKDGRCSDRVRSYMEDILFV